MEFISLINKNKLNEVKKYANKHHIDINARPTYYDRITVQYANDSKVEIIKYLLEENCGNILAFLNTTDMNEYQKGMTVLIKKGLNANLLYENSFIHACAQGALDIAHYILSLNQPINIHAHDNLAFHLSCKNNQLNSVKFLIEHSFIPNEKDLIEASFKPNYSYLIDYPSNKNEYYNVLDYLITHYKFDNISSLGELLIKILMPEFPHFEEKISSIIKKLIIHHNISYTLEIEKALGQENQLKELFEINQLHTKLSSTILNHSKESVCCVKI